MKNELGEAVMTANFTAVSELITCGADVNALDVTLWQRPLSAAIYWIDEPAARHRMMKQLLDLGANQKLINHEPERLGPLFDAVLREDADALRILLEAGADPNAEMCTTGESLYDYAEFQYRYERGWLSKIPEVPTEIDGSSEEHWIGFLDRMAIRCGALRPAYLVVLRDGGARRLKEQTIDADR